MSAQRHRGLSEQAADTAIDQACRMLRLPTIRSQFPDLADADSREQMSYKGFLAELLLAECDDRARRRSERRIKAAAFPREKSLRAFDPHGSIKDMWKARFSSNWATPACPYTFTKALAPTPLCTPPRDLAHTREHPRGPHDALSPPSWAQSPRDAFMSCPLSGHAAQRRV